MTVASVVPEQRAVPQKHMQPQQAKNEHATGVASGTSLVSESYQVSKDGDSFELQYSKTTYESHRVDIDALAPEHKKLLEGFDVNDFQEKLKSQLIDMVFNANSKAKEQLSNDSLIEKYGNDVIYAVPEETEAAEVPEFWNAENTSQRLIDFAMSFKDVAVFENDAEYIQEIRDAVIEGFRQAKGIIGNVDDRSHKLYNDTFDLTMQKFDALLEDAQGANQATPTAMEPINMVA